MTGIRKVGFLTQDFTPNTQPPLPGGCAYYRCFLPMQALGVETRMGFPAWDSAGGFGVLQSQNRALYGFDVVYLKLLMHRRVPTQIRMAQALGQKVIVDIDDFYDDLPESNLAHLATDPTRDKFNNREHYREVILAADRIITATPFLHDYYSRLHPDVRLVRNGVLPEQFTVRKVRDRRPVFGWIGGIPWRGGDLETLRAWLPEFLETYDVGFHHSGHADSVPGRDVVPSFAEVVGIDPDRVTTSPLQTIDKYFSMFTFDVGLVPLSDIPFNRAKSNLKGLEYSASGIPFIAQALPEYEQLNSVGVGRVAYTAEHWWAHATALLDYRTRKSDARVNLGNVLRDHTIMAREQDWREAVLEW